MATMSTQEAQSEGTRLIGELSRIRDSLSDHAERHPSNVDVRSARQQVQEAIAIAVQAACIPNFDSGAKLWLGYIVDAYGRIIQRDAARVAHSLYG